MWMTPTTTRDFNRPLCKKFENFRQTHYTQIFADDHPQPPVSIYRTPHQSHKKRNTNNRIQLFSKICRFLQILMPFFILNFKTRIDFLKHRSRIGIAHIFQFFLSKTTARIVPLGHNNPNLYATHQTRSK